MTEIPDVRGKNLTDNYRKNKVKDIRSSLL
jgi:hypothetical protein